VEAVANAALKAAVFLVSMALVLPLTLAAVELLTNQSTPLPVGTVSAALAPDSPADAPAGETLPSTPSEAESQPPAPSPEVPEAAYQQVPRVKFVSQFDGGPMQNANCTMAAGAMLADSAFGVVTTGSILRSRQSDQRGGTDLGDLGRALRSGYGLTVVSGGIKPAELRALLTAGYGVVIQGDYERIPVEWRLQRKFDGDHAIYLDAFYPGDAVTPPAYFVMDPLGTGDYRGGWWPATVIDEFAMAFSGPGRISAAWGQP
jgi:hypothetical protein